MPIAFNANEVFEMAERIETNAEAFYRKAARQHPDPNDAAVFLDLAGMEAEHRRVFHEMRVDLSDKEKELTAYDPDGEASLYLDALADSRGAEGAPAVADRLTGQETIEEVLRTAIGMEKRSVLFYVGIRDAVPPNLGRPRIERIIEEEKKHVVILNQQLKVRSGKR